MDVNIHPHDQGIGAEAMAQGEDVGPLAAAHHQNALDGFPLRIGEGLIDIDLVEHG